MIRQRVALVGLAVALSLSASSARVTAPRTDLPARLSDGEFWRLVTDFSEPSGFFNSDNLVSNEDAFQDVIPELARTVRPGGVYLGVGPDQNFTYIVALQPRLAFITDVRRGNLLVHLMYKAIVELSPDRAAFLSRLFSRSNPGGLGPDASAGTLLDAYAGMPADASLYERNLRDILARLTETHGFRLEDGDAAGIEYTYKSFFVGGPDLTFISNGAGRRNRYPTYRALHTATDRAGRNHSYLASEANYQRLRTMEERNLIVPVVGDFAGPRALRAEAGYLKAHQAVVTMFYLSNVENYLFQDGLWDRFRANVAELPIDDSSTFIRSCFNSCSTPGGPRAVTLLDSMAGLLRDADAGRIQSYWDVLSHSHGAVTK